MDEDQSAVIAELEKRNTQLSSMVTNYKRIIEDTVCIYFVRPDVLLLTSIIYTIFVYSTNDLFFQEGMLNKLQQHVEAEETKWQQQLAEKEAELVAVTREKDELLSRLSVDQSNGVCGPHYRSSQSVTYDSSFLFSCVFIFFTIVAGAVTAGRTPEQAPISGSREDHSLHSACIQQRQFCHH